MFFDLSVPQRKHIPLWWLSSSHEITAPMNWCNTFATPSFVDHCYPAFVDNVHAVIQDTLLTTAVLTHRIEIFAIGVRCLRRRRNLIGFQLYETFNWKFKTTLFRFNIRHENRLTRYVNIKKFYCYFNSLKRCGSWPISQHPRFHFYSLCCCQRQWTTQISGIIAERPKGFQLNFRDE